MKRLTVLLIPIILTSITGCAQNKVPNSNDGSAMKRYNDSILLIRRGGPSRTDSLRVVNMAVGQDANYKFNKFHFGIENKTNKTWRYQKILCHFYLKGNLIGSGEAHEDDDNRFGDFRKIEPNTLKGFTVMTSLAGNEVDCRVQIVYDNSQQPSGSAIAGVASKTFTLSQSLPFNGSAQSLNTQDTTTCINVLCSGRWVFNYKYMTDTTTEPVSGDLLPNKYATQIKMVETTWVFHRNGTYKINGRYFIMDGSQTLVRKDTVIYGTWSFGIARTEYLGGDYNTKIRVIKIIQQAISYSGLQLVSAGTIMSYWGEGDQNDVKMNAPFVYTENDHCVWLHTPL